MTVLAQLQNFIKPFCFIIAFVVFSAICFSQVKSNSIQINQSGYYPLAPKIAVLTETTNNNDFYLLSVDLKDTLFHGKLSDEKQSAYSSTKTRIADFSIFQKNGRYIIRIGTLVSYPFVISNNILSSTAIASLKAFYFQRASIPLEENYAGKWKRSGFHPDNKVIVHASAASNQRPEGTIISCTGGWYDAGDYNKYIVNSGITMGTLFSAYEDFPEYFAMLKTNIPETGNGVPDILNEAVYNLRWMLTMQDPNDGAVYHKCTNAAFDGMVMPGVTKEPRYVVQKTSAAALDFAAVMAQASRIFLKFKTEFPSLSDSCITASKKAFDWAKNNSPVFYEQDKMNQSYKPIITTGAYGDNNIKDEILWAASELYISTKDPFYFSFISSLRLNPEINLPSWNNVGMMAVYSLLNKNISVPEMDSTLIFSLRNILLKNADRFISNTNSNVFKTVMGQNKADFNWGSNSNAANQGMLLIKAYQLTKDKRYINDALTNMDYLLGRNATGYCFITGIGTKSPMFPHHRQSTADEVKEPVPGLMVGGPNPGLQDHCNYPFTEPETAYVDISCAYASNEIAINWNAPLVYLSNALIALKKIAGYTIQ